MFPRSILSQPRLLHDGRGLGKGSRGPLVRLCPLHHPVQESSDGCCGQPAQSPPALRIPALPLQIVCLCAGISSREQQGSWVVLCKEAAAGRVVRAEGNTLQGFLFFKGKRKIVIDC